MHNPCYETYRRSNSKCPACGEDWGRVGNGNGTVVPVGEAAAPKDEWPRRTRRSATESENEQQQNEDVDVDVDADAEAEVDVDVDAPAPAPTLVPVPDRPGPGPSQAPVRRRPKRAVNNARYLAQHRHSWSYSPSS
jgi:hypothetical protein